MNVFQTIGKVNLKNGTQKTLGKTNGN